MSGSAARKTSGKTPVKLVPQPHGGALQVGNPGNKGGGRHKAYAVERAELLAANPIVWDVQEARAKAGDLKALEFASTLAWGKPTEKVEASGALEIVVKYVTG